MELSLKLELDTLLCAITEKTEQLERTLSLSGVVEDYLVYKVEKQRENRLVSIIDGLECSLRVFSDFNCIAPDNTKETSLYPGYVALNNQKALSEGVGEIILAVNNAKKELKEFLDKHNKPKAIVLTQGPKVKLNPILYESYPMKSPVQIFRSVKLLQPEINMVHFKWVRKQRYDNLTIDSAKRIALYNIDKPPALRYTTSRWGSHVQSVIDKLDSLPPSTKLKRIKPAPYTPQVALRIKETGRWQKLHGSLPVLLYCEGKEQIKLTAGLTDLNELDLMNADGLTDLGWQTICPELGFYKKNRS
ncbi:MAG: hypothetical protein CML20_14425 [Rheinheimera sp.]|jgi:hypothetical protein|nr:hypothetical protein [Rheinheimera sp.]|tara:strand:- start:82 stop:993 length:912 start_codon:yes stop_codon:yes gene_type:complete